MSSANIQLVESLVQVIRSLSDEERSLLEEKLFSDQGYPTTRELIRLTQQGQPFEFLEHEPDLYTFEDGEPI
ncbi:MAG: hypothetical protein SFW36_17060 [Leptolyngbyaceae cyanobacterium bins.59]|nr:hypothetical protein [Leptolyngbyaceae cyanobacterium bins.59]